MSPHADQAASPRRFGGNAISTEGAADATTNGSAPGFLANSTTDEGTFRRSAVWRIAAPLDAPFRAPFNASAGSRPYLNISAPIGSAPMSSTPRATKIRRAAIPDFMCASPARDGTRGKVGRQAGEFKVSNW